MKEVAEKMLDAMRLALEKKKAGAPGNHQGILNNMRRIFETTVKMQAGRDTRLLALIAQAVAMQTEGARTFPGTARKTAATVTTSRKVDMAMAFEVQKKRAQAKSAAVADKTAAPDPKKKAPAPAVEVPADEPAHVVDMDLIQSLLSTTPAKFRDRFGGLDGLKSFGKDLFGMGFEGEDDYTEIVRTLKEKLRELIPQG